MGNEFGIFLREARKRKGFTVNQLAVKEIRVDKKTNQERHKDSVVIESIDFY